MRVKVEEARERTAKTQRERNCMLLGKRRVTEDGKWHETVK